MRKAPYWSKGGVGMVLSGILLFAFPALAVTTQHQRLHEGTPLRLSVDSTQIEQTSFGPRLKISTPINQISTTQLTGENRFVANDRAYVFMSPGPNDIWYPYAISKRPPESSSDNDTQLVLAGRVTNITRDSLAVEYGFETLFLPSNFQEFESKTRLNEVEIMVDKTSRSTLRTLRIGDQFINQRDKFKLAPPE